MIVMVGAAALAWFWWHRSSAAAPADDGGPVAEVQVTPLRRQNIARTIEAFGVVAPSPTGGRVMTAAFDCVVRQLNVATGARVAAGDVLMEIAPSPDAALALAAARSALKLAKEALASTQQRFDLKLATRQELLSAQQARQEAILRLQSLRDRGLGGDGRILAPADGVVSRIDLTAGTLVPTGGALLTLATERNLEAHVGVEPADLAQVTAGSAVTLASADRAAGAPVTGRVVAAGEVLDVASGVALVRVAVPANAPLLLGEHVRASIEVKHAEGLVVPRSAVLPDGNQHVLFTVQAGRAVRHDVTVGITADDQVEIRGEGLHPGDSVVTLGNYELEDGMAVQVANAPSAGNPGRETTK